MSTAEVMAPSKIRWRSWSARANRTTVDPSPPPAPGVGADVVPPLSPKMQLARAALVMVCALSFALLLQLLFVSALQQRAAQERAFDAFRSDLAKGTAPIGPTDSEGRPIRPGAPVAYLEIPAIGLRQVVGEGTTSGNLFAGPGHRRDTPLPGQVGSSVVFGRRAAFGGPFGRINELERGDIIRATTGQGTFEYRVIGVRAEGDPLPAPPEPGEARLLLATADGQPFLPAGVLRVDAELAGEPVGGAPRLVSTSNLPAEEQLMAGDARTLWALVLWIQIMIALALGAVWSWHRWGRAQTWIVFLPPLLLVGLSATGEVARLLPNLS